MATKFVNQLKGISICGGEAIGKVLIADDKEIINICEKEKNILIVPAITADLVIYFNSIQAIITETGSRLSHGSILAREYGLPTIILENATQIFRNGNLIKVNSYLGEIVIIK